MMLDTSGWLCLFDAGDAQQKVAVRLFQEMRVHITHSYVLSEFVTLVHARGLRRQDATAFVRALLENRRVDVIWVDEELHREAMDLLDLRPDKNYSLCDAVSFVLMRKREIYQALTTDHHFVQEGFQPLL